MFTSYLFLLWPLLLFHPYAANECSRDLSRFAEDRPGYDLAIAVYTGEDNEGYKPTSARTSYFRRRQGIRKSWKALAKEANIPTFFLISDYRLREVDHQEVETFKDILLVPDPTGEAWGYYGLSRKTLFLIQFMARQCATVKFVAKVDDDTYVHVPRLALFAKITHGKSMYVGNRLCGIHSTGVPKQWEAPKYQPISGLWDFPCYMQGGGYMLSGDVVRALGTLAATLSLQHHSIEDASLGMWLFGLNLTRVNIRSADLTIDFDGDMNTSYVLNVVCNDRWLFLHRVVCGRFPRQYTKYCGPRGLSWAAAQRDTQGLRPHIPAD
eukprot:EG_transcript_20058